jgi:hypothetical protein
MRHGLVALALLGVAVGCSSAADEGVSQSSNATDKKILTQLASSLSITEVAAFQSLKVTLEKDGVAVPASLPILANRDTLVRAYAQPAAGATAEEVDAVLEVFDASGALIATLDDRKIISAASTEADLTSTFNFNVAAANMPVGATFRVSLTTPATFDAKKPAPNAQFPANGARAAMGIAAGAEHLRIVFVPVHYTFGGVDIMPDTSPEQIERDRKVFLSLYPLADVEITMHAPYEFTGEIKANGQGFGQVLREMLALRAADGVAGDVYYWGAFQPTATIQDYCPHGCVTGLSGIYGPDATNGRASVGVGFTGANSSFTMAHEVGHAHGRPHAPCGGAAGPDPDFPYSDGGIGTWAYAPTSQKVIDPSTTKDFMSYCHPQWISDYNYKKLLERLTYVNQAAATATPPGAFAVKLPYRFVEVNPDGSLSIGNRIDLVEAPQGESHAVSFKDRAGNTIAKGDAVFTPYDHIGGGYALVPEIDGFTSVNIDGLGTAKR